MKYIELFAGVGGFRLGIERAFSNQGGGEQPTKERKYQPVQLHAEGERSAVCAFANEWDKYAAQTYNKNFGGSIDQRDITTIPTGDIPDHDLLVGGFPCQAFSVAGKRAGFDDTRGTMFFEIARILKDKKPRHLLLENVKGLLSHDTGRTFQTILGILTDLGYRVEWQVLNSKDFGVPQNRERVFIVGHLGDCCGRQVFPIIGANTQNYEPGRVYPEDQGRLPQGENGQEEEQHPGNPHNNAPGEYSRNERGTSATRQPLIRFLNRNQKNIEGDYAYTVDASQTSGVKISKTIRTGGKGSPHGSKQNWDSYEVEGRIRRLTPTECERLQGFPDGWTRGVSDTQRYKQMGNAVTVNVIEAVVGRLYAGQEA